MKLIIDTDDKVLSYINGEVTKKVDLYSKKAFELISEQWIKIGWNENYSYTFSWLGRPIIQLPEDMIRIQEVIYSVKPDVIIETGVAHGGSLIYYASLCKLMNKGKVLGIDIEIRNHNRKAIEEHELSKYITLIEGDSTAENTINKVKSCIDANDSVIVILDSCHSKNHVLKELKLYSHIITPGSYIVATDGIMNNLFDVPKGHEEWIKDNPCEAVKEFLKDNTDFVLEQPKWVFNESNLDKNVTHWPGAWLRKL